MRSQISLTSSLNQLDVTWRMRRWHTDVARRRRVFYMGSARRGSKWRMT